MEKGSWACAPGRPGVFMDGGAVDTGGRVKLGHIPPCSHPFVQQTAGRRAGVPWPHCLWDSPAAVGGTDVEG